MRVAGELDIATAASLERVLRGAQRSAKLVVLDLRELTFMDSSGVHVIVDASRRARQMKRQLILVRSCMQVDDVFAMTGASEAVEIGDLDTIGPPVRRFSQVAPQRWAS